ncbi:hypothetical protein IMSAGC007_03692 [Lachnospiraceae bacterium]|nr:hypothetical protein IMSAGC007_03692 [Lachnospiraceae bacterium]
MHDSAIEMAKRMLVDSIWKSANLEGLGTTFPKTEAILANAPTTTKTEEVLFVINMKRAWQFLLDNLEYHNCIMLLREFDKIVGELLFHYAGEIRTIPVQIGGTSWEPELPHTGIIMEAMNEIEQIEEIELRALKYFCFIARTQMFIDGNKRVAQLMANKVLIENNIGIFQIPIEKLEEFKGMLIDFYETGNDTKIIGFMKEYCIRRIRGGGKRIALTIPIGRERRIK